MAMQNPQPHFYEYTATFEVVAANEPFKDANTLIAMSGAGEWAMSMNLGAVDIGMTAEIPVNALTQQWIAEGLLHARQEVE